MENNTNTLPTVESLQDIQEYAIWYAKNEGFESWRALVSKIGPEQANKYYIGMCQDFAVLFAKHHVQECKEAIKEKAELKYGKDGCLYINPDSIENAYSEDEIK